MQCFLTRNARITEQASVNWLLQNAHRVVSLRALKYMDSHSGKLMAMMADGSVFHAPFVHYRSMIGWAFRPEFSGLPFGVFGLFDKDPFAEWDDLQLKAENWISAGSDDHWKLLSELMGK